MTQKRRWQYGVGSVSITDCAAGAGKTYVLNRFIGRAKRRGKSIAVTATTASLHSFKRYNNPCLVGDRSAQ